MSDVALSKASARKNLEGLDAGVDEVSPINWGNELQTGPIEAQMKALAKRALAAGYNFTDDQMGHGI